MQTIPFGGLSINPGAEPEGYDEQKDLIERGVRKIQSVCARDGNGDINVIRAVLTEEKGTLFTVCINGDNMEFGLYSNGTVTQDMVYGHPPIRVQHMDRLCSRVENDLQGRLKYQDDPAIEKAWQVCLDAKFEKAVASLGEDTARQL